MSLIKQLFLIFFNFWVHQDLFAAACCGGGVAANFLIVGDDKAQLNLAYTFSQIKVDIDNQGFWRERQKAESLRIIKFEGAHIFWDRFQAGLSLPIVKKTVGNEESMAMGDFSTTLGYEYLPDWDYNLFRPKGLGYLHVIFPTGKSIFQSSNGFLADVTGRGFFTLGVGTLLLKNLNNFDVFTDLGFHRSLKRNFSTGQIIIPGWGGNLTLGGGFSFSNLRVGVSLATVFEDGVESDGAMKSKGHKQRFTSVELPLSYQFDNEWQGILKYSDKGLVGWPTNTSLDKSLTLQIQKKWPR